MYAKHAQECTLSSRSQSHTLLHVRHASRKGGGGQQHESKGLCFPVSYQRASIERPGLNHCDNDHHAPNSPS